jgi:hypothetical protein
MRSARPAQCILLVATLGCGGGDSVPESGAALLHVTRSANAPVPDELRAWVYDQGGVLWRGVRIPTQGALPVPNGQNLGTILIAPGAVKGKLRVHLRGFASGARILDGLLTIDWPGSGDRTYTVSLETAVPVDADGDDVPDLIDDCLGVANPTQGGCPARTSQDGSVDGGVGIDDGGGANPPLDVSPMSLDGKPGYDAEDDAALTGPGDARGTDGSSRTTGVKDAAFPD